jgi:hypothetical protein
MSIERLINHHPKYLSNSNYKLNNLANITNNSSSSSSINQPSSTFNSGSIHNCNNLQETRLALASLISAPTTTTVSALPLHGSFSKIANNHIANKISLRFLNPDDINELKTLCSEWFPVE